MNPSEAGAGTLARPRAAYQRLLAEIDAVPNEALTPITLDVPTAVTTALGVLPELRALSEEIRNLPGFDVSAFDKLEDYALALGHSYAVYLAASAPPEALSGLVEDATQGREVLMGDLFALVGHGVIPANRSADISRTLGHRGVAYDIARLVEIFREFWLTIENKTALTADRLDELEVLSDRLVTAVGVREQGAAIVSEATVRRQKAFSLLVRAYDSVRRAVSYLRWDNGDVDAIIPSLYAGRNSRRKSDSPTAATESPAPNAGVLTGTPAPTPVRVSPAASAAGVQESPVPAGLPGSNPFSV